jgi:CDP-diacylglycerol---glycerol-3-phosphate 3-phosphatidyltransferase
MTFFRQFAARRGVVIAAIGPAKWKTAFQLIWQGAAYFWFFAATVALVRGWSGALWRGAAFVIGICGAATMTVAVVLTLYSLWLYVARYGRIFVASGAQS